MALAGGVIAGFWGYPSDSLANIWRFWRLAKGGELSLIGLSPPGFFVPAFFLTKSFGEVRAYNFLVLFSVASSFAVFFSLSRRLFGRNKPASFLSTLAFGTSLYFQWHGMQNLELVLGSAFLPLFLWALLKLEEAVRAGDGGRPIGFLVVRRGLHASLAFALVFLASFQIGYLAAVFAAGFFFFRRLPDRLAANRPLITKKIAAGYLLLAVFSFIFTLPGTLPLLNYYRGALDPQVSANIKEGLTRNTVLDLVAYGARPWDYFLPSIYHPVFGRSVREFYQYLRESKSYQFWSPFLPERPNYLTLTAAVFALYAVWKARRSRKLSVVKPRLTAAERGTVFTLAFLAVWMFLVSLPAVVTVRGVKLYFPSFFLFKLFPMFRVYARAGVFVLLCVALLAGYGLKFALQGIKNGEFKLRAVGFEFSARRSVILAAVVCGFILFENLNFPPFSVMDVSQTPRVYKWLENQPGDLLIVEYPKDNSRVDIGGGCPDWLEPNIVRDWNPAYELFYQRLHKKRLFDYERLSKKERATIGDLADPRTYKILSRYKVDYIIVHTKDPVIGIHPWPYPQENPLDECWPRRVMEKPRKAAAGFKLVKEFDGGAVYRVVGL